MRAFSASYERWFYRQLRNIWSIWHEAVPMTPLRWCEMAAECGGACAFAFGLMIGIGYYLGG